MEDHVELVKNALLFPGEGRAYHRALYKDVSLVVKKGTPLLLLGASDFPAVSENQTLARQRLLLGTSDFPAVPGNQALTRQRFNVTGNRVSDGSPVEITLTGTYISTYIIGEIAVESIDGQQLDSQHIEQIIRLVRKKEIIVEHDETIIIEDNEKGFYYRAPKPPTAEDFITESRNNKRVHRMARQIMGIVGVSLRSIMNGKTAGDSITKAVAVGDTPDELWRLAVIEAQEHLINMGYAPLQTKPIEGKPGEYLIILTLPTI